MDLTLEKDILLRTMGVPPELGPGFRFDRAARRSGCSQGDYRDRRPRPPAYQGQLRRAAPDRWGLQGDPGRHEHRPVLLADQTPEGPYHADLHGRHGLEAEDDDDVALICALLKLSETIIHATCMAQIKAGAKAIFLCEPAANLVLFSPNQIRDGSSVYDDFVIQPNLRLKAMFDATGTDLQVLN